MSDPRTALLYLFGYTDSMYTIQQTNVFVNWLSGLRTSGPKPPSSAAWIVRMRAILAMSSGG